MSGIEDAYTEADRRCNRPRESAPTCICGAAEPCIGHCERHDRDLHGYPCADCHREWQAANPATHKAVSNLAAGRGSTAAYVAAKRADAARRAALADPETETDRSEDA